MTDFQKIPTPPAPGTQPAQPSRRGRGLAIGVGVVGAVIVAGAIGGSAVAAVAAPAGAGTYATSSSVDGVDEVDIEMSAGTVTVRFDDVREATLDVSSNGSRSADGWRMDVRDGELVISQDHGWRGWRWFGFRNDGEVHAEIVLPRSLESKIDGSVTLNAGRATVTGGFLDLDLTVNAGELSYEGSSHDLSTTVNAGQANVAVTDADSLELSISAGRLIADVVGTAPSETSVSVTAGNAEVRLPRGTYEVERDATFGDLTVDVDTADSSPNSLELTVAAGDLTVGYAR
ncbi:DUF4097 family beta strand repeat-containing protein [Microbacterium sp. ZW T5_56]|uniref:DUF4097 family beta strand repeat-containing protein n=1 Tax=Microbacterium sp. ZW T5_56 TaxID=3378081 RepID=UPI0038550A3B